MPPKNDFLTDEQRSNIQAAQQSVSNLERLSSAGFGDVDLGANPNLDISLPTTQFADKLNERLEGSTSTNALVGNVSRNDIVNRALQSFESNRATQERILGLLQPSDRETELRDQASQLQQQIEQLTAQETQGVGAIRAQEIPQPLIGRQAEVLREQIGQVQQQIAFQALPIQRELQGLVDQRSQQVDALTKVMQFSQENTDTLLRLQQLTAPEVFRTDTDPSTGEVFAFMRDPLTGEIVQEAIGRLTPQTAALEFLAKGTFIDANNQQVFYGVTPDGEIITQIIGQARAPQSSDGPAIKATERQAAGFAARVEDAAIIIDELAGGFTGLLSRVPLPEGAKSEDRKRLEQAERNFINAILRRESGAAIAPTEFQSAALQYFPQRGDTQDVLAQKKRNRQTVFESLRLEAGEAFTELRETLPPVIGNEVQIGGQTFRVGDIIENSQGQRGRVEADGTITPL